MKIVYSFNKKGTEGAAWAREIAAASDARHTFVPFNHGQYCDPSLYTTAQQLDRLYQSRDPRLFDLYRAFEGTLAESRADAVIVANAPPYHPDYLRRVSVYKVLYSADDPGATYLINIPYLHAYDHVFFVAPTYSPDMTMKEKMEYAGMVNADWLPISVFDFECAPDRSEEEVFSRHRDIDVIYVGGFWRQKVPTLSRVRRALGRRFRMYGLFGAKHNLYINARYGYGGWVRPVSFEERVSLYQRARIGINVHWNDYGLGNQRLYHLPANGVMQISDCAHSLHHVFEPGREIVGYEGVDDLIDKIRYYLRNDSERLSIARNGYRRTMRDYRFATVSRRAAMLMEQGMQRLNRSGTPAANRG